MCAYRAIGGGGVNGRARPTVQSASRWAVPTTGARGPPSAWPSALGSRCTCVAAHHTHSFIVRRFFRSHHPSTGRPPRTTFRSRVSSSILYYYYNIYGLSLSPYVSTVHTASSSSSCVNDIAIRVPQSII